MPQPTPAICELARAALARFWNADRLSSRSDRETRVARCHDVAAPCRSRSRGCERRRSIQKRLAKSNLARPIVATIAQGALARWREGAGTRWRGDAKAR